MTEWYSKNRERQNAKNREFYFRNHEKNKERRREYHAKNRERDNSRNSLNYQDPEKLIQHWHYRAKALAKKRGATVFMSFEEFVALRTQTNCHWCGIVLTHPITNVDHVMPLCEGGQHTAENTVLACANCNLSREWERRVKYPERYGLTE